MTTILNTLLCNHCKVSITTLFLILYTCESFSYRVDSAETSTTQNLYSTNKMSGEGDRNLNVDYNGILKAQKDKTLIIDVREDSEIKETGKLPGSIHIPMGNVSATLLNLSNQEFEEKYNREKPTHDTKIILSCRSGRRSASVQENLQKLGYKNALNYNGGYLDWQSNQNNSTL